MGQNVWVKCGTVRNLYAEPGTIATGAGDWHYKDSPNATYHATVTGTGTVTAIIDIEMSNDGVNALETAAGTITLSGTTSSTDGFTTDAAWKYVRANVTALTGTGATVQVYMGT